MSVDPNLVFTGNPNPPESLSIDPSPTLDDDLQLQVDEQKIPIEQAVGLQQFRDAQRQPAAGTVPLPEGISAQPSAGLGAPVTPEAPVKARVAVSQVPEIPSGLVQLQSTEEREQEEFARRSEGAGLALRSRQPTFRQTIGDLSTIGSARQGTGAGEPEGADFDVPADPRIVMDTPAEGAEPAAPTPTAAARGQATPAAIEVSDAAPAAEPAPGQDPGETREQYIARLESELGPLPGDSPGLRAVIESLKAEGVVVEEGVTAQLGALREQGEVLQRDVEGVGQAQRRRDTRESTRRAQTGEFLESFEEEDQAFLDERARVRQDLRTGSETNQTYREGIQRNQQSMAQGFTRNDEELDREIRDSKPVDFWDSEEAPNKVLAAISLFLGGFGAGLTGTPNFALQIIESEISRYVERGKEQRASLRERREDLRSAYVIRERAETRLIDEANRRDTQLRSDAVLNFDRIDSLRGIAREDRDFRFQQNDVERAVDAAAVVDAMRKVRLSAEAFDLTNKSADIVARHAEFMAALDTRMTAAVADRDLARERLQEERLQFMVSAGDAYDARMQEVQQREADRAQRSALGFAQVSVAEERNRIDAARFALGGIAELMELSRNAAELEAVRTSGGGGNIPLASVQNNEDLRKRFIPDLNDPSVGRLANTEADATEFKKGRAFILEAGQTLDQIQAIQDEHGIELIPFSPPAIEAKALGETLILLMKDLFALGALQAHERTLIAQILPENITSLSDLFGVQTARMRSARGFLARKLEAMQRNLGLPGTQQGSDRLAQLVLAEARRTGTTSPEGMALILEQVMTSNAANGSDEQLQEETRQAADAVNARVGFEAEGGAAPAQPILGEEESVLLNVPTDFM